MQVLIVEALLQPAAAARMTPRQWDLLIRQGRRANVLGVLCEAIRSSGQFDHVFAPARAHLVSAEVIAQRQGAAVRWEVRCIREALGASGAPFVLLKGAAYVMADLPAARGRVFSDVDILVQRDVLHEVESNLLIAGWQGTATTTYDQRYYRQWMHEIPPMQHMRRGTVIDVHHAILPPTARTRVRSSLMFDAAVPLPACEGVQIFAPADMVLHSAAHLFHEGEFDNGLRDLLDLDRLLRCFGSENGFWSELVPRAVEVGLARPLNYALRYASSMLQTPVPAFVMAEITAADPLGRARLAVMDFCFLRALRPNHPSCADMWTPLARWLLYVRSHWLRMPLFMLLHHLGRKAIMDMWPPKDTAAGDKVNPP